MALQGAHRSTCAVLTFWHALTSARKKRLELTRGLTSTTTCPRAEAEIACLLACCFARVAGSQTVVFP
eukprot:8120515-Pyramimonas_sp.AAC.1